MRYIGVVLALWLLGGCGTYHTLEELEQEAMLTGDWSRVEQRERIRARRSMRTGVPCPSGYIKYCENRITGNRCACIDSDAVRRSLISLRSNASNL